MSNGARHGLGIVAGLVLTPLMAAGLMYGTDRLARSYVFLRTELSYTWSGYLALVVVAVLLGLLAGSRISPVAALIPGLAFAIVGAAWVASPSSALRHGRDALPDRLDHGYTALGSYGAFLIIGVLLIASGLLPSRWRARTATSRTQAPGAFAGTPAGLTPLSGAPSGPLPGGQAGALQPPGPPPALQPSGPHGAGPVPGAGAPPAAGFGAPPVPYGEHHPHEPVFGGPPAYQSGMPGRPGPGAPQGGFGAEPPPWRSGSESGGAPPIPPAPSGPSGPPVPSSPPPPLPSSPPSPPAGASAWAAPSEPQGSPDDGGAFGPWHGRPDLPERDEAAWPPAAPAGPGRPPAFGQAPSYDSPYDRPHDRPHDRPAEDSAHSEAPAHGEPAAMPWSPPGQPPSAPPPGQSGAEGPPEGAEQESGAWTRIFGGTDEGADERRPPEPPPAQR